MTLNSTLLQNSISSSVNSTTIADMQSSRYSSNLLGNSSGGTRQSPLGGSDLPGPSGMTGPMQHAPLVSQFYHKIFLF